MFGDFTYDFSPEWSVSLGGRYTNDERRAKVLRQTYIRGGQPLLGGSPPYDQTGNTALVGATMMFEILCLIADRHFRAGRGDRPRDRSAR